MRACVCMDDVCLLCVYECIPVFVGTHTHGRHAEVTRRQVLPLLSAFFSETDRLTLRLLLPAPGWLAHVTCTTIFGFFVWIWSIQAQVGRRVRHSLYHTEPCSQIPHYLLNVSQSGGKLRLNQFLEK